VEEGLEKIIHGGLECGGCIAKAKGHYLALIMAIVGAKGCFWDVLWCHANLMESLLKIKFGKPGSFTQIVEEFVNSRQGKPIPYGDCVESTIINATTP
jgi:hypothetical protein